MEAVAPGTGFTISSGSLSSRRHDVLTRWLKPDAMDEEECGELAARAVARHLRAASRHWSQATAGLTGGMDSRAIAASIVGESIPIDHFRTHGSPSTREVILASHLARTTSIPHRIETHRALPTDDPSTLRQSITMAARWQGGFMDAKAYKGFSARGERLGQSRINIMGKHGEIGRGYYHGRVARAVPGKDLAAGLLQYLTEPLAVIHPSQRDAVREDVRRAITAAAEQAPSPADLLDVFYLMERTRRWASGTVYGQTGKVITPFLNADYLRASFALRASRRPDSPCQQAIVARQRPDWLQVPYLSDASAKAWCKQRVPSWRWEWWRLTARVARWRGAAHREYVDVSGDRYAFRNDRYWASVGRSLFDDAATKSALVQTVFDTKSLPASTPKEPDILAVVAAVERAFA